MPEFLVQVKKIMQLREEKFWAEGYIHRGICGQKATLFRELLWSSSIHFKFAIIGWLYICNYPEIVPIMSLFLHLHLVFIGIYYLSIRFTYAYLSLYTLTDFLSKHLLSAHWVLNIMLTLGGGGVCGDE